MKFLWFILCLFSFSVFAAPSSPFYFSVAAKGGLGSGSSFDGQAMETRQLYVFGGETTLGFFVYGVMVGGSAEYLIWKQKTDPSEVSNSNISGRQVILSPVLGIPLGQFLFQLKYPLSSKFTMDKKSAAGEEVEYSKAIVRFSLMLAYSLGNSFIGVEYSKLEYKNLSLDGTDTALPRDNRLMLSSFGLVYGYKF